MCAHCAIPKGRDHGKTVCLFTPFDHTKLTFESSRKQCLISKVILGFWIYLKAKLLPYVKLGAVLGSKVDV